MISGLKTSSGGITKKAATAGVAIASLGLVLVATAEPAQAFRGGGGNFYHGGGFRGGYGGFRGGYGGFRGGYGGGYGFRGGVGRYGYGGFGYRRFGWGGYGYRRFGYGFPVALGLGLGYGLGYGYPYGGYGYAGYSDGTYGAPYQGGGYADGAGEASIGYRHQRGLYRCGPYAYHTRLERRACGN